jgi:hypothetical protein
MRAGAGRAIFGAVPKQARTAVNHISEIEPQQQQTTFPQGGAPPHAPAKARDELFIRGPFPARVKGSDARGRRFKVSAALSRLSAASCDVQGAEGAAPGSLVSVATRVSRAVVVLRGTVERILSSAEGGTLVSVRITRYRFVPGRDGRRS